MEFLHNDKETFSQAINLVTNKNGIRPEIVEKDYYVTMILRLLSERLPFIVFKGGTSLSKCHKAIKRFSEDIDITIDTTISQGQKKKVKEAIEEVSAILGLSIPNIDKTRSRRDYNRYEIEYNPIDELDDVAVLPAVILETSYTAISFPVSELPVHNYIGDMMVEEAPDYIEKYALSPFTMKVQDISRTLADKVFAICDYYLDDKSLKNSRHIYDIFKLLPTVSLDNEFQSLVVAVRNERMKSPVCYSAKNGINPQSILQKIVQERAFENDYRAVTEKILLEKVSYEEALQALIRIIESKMFVFHEM